MYSGCKFSAEEERVAIELQAQFGNRWAKIATYLPGRTDNDVKNFWSTRRKRLERILKTPPPNSQKKNKGKDLVFHEPPLLEVRNLITFILNAKKKKKKKKVDEVFGKLDYPFDLHY